MNQDQFDPKYEQLVQQVADYLKRDGKRLLKSGGIDPEIYADDYRLPLIILNAAMEDAKASFAPLRVSDHKAAKNLSHF